jgi:hypothetical protein
MKWRNVWSVSGVLEEEFSRITESYVGKGTIKYAMSIDGPSRTSRGFRLEFTKWAKADIDQAAVTRSRF